MESLKKDVVDSAAIVGTLIAVIAALLTWRAPEIVNALLLRPGGSAGARDEHKRQLRAALVSLIILDVLLVSLDPTLASVFVRIQDQTNLSLVDADIVLTTFQTVTVWMFAMTAFALFATVAVIGRLLQR
jgi:hypothetical protein